MFDDHGLLTGPRMRARNAIAIVCAAFIHVALSAHSFAGPGHSGDEGHAHDTPASGSVQSPRIIATSETFQLVGILKGGQVTFYLDRDADNAPVIDAVIEVTSGDTTVIAEKQPDGTFSVQADGLVKPGENEMQFSITAGDQSDLLGGVLIVPSIAHDESTATRSFLSLLNGSQTMIWGAVGGVIALLLGGLLGSLFAKRLPVAAIIMLTGLLAISGPETASAGPGHSGDEGHAHGPETATGASDLPRRLSDGSVFLPKPTQRLLEVRTKYVQPETARRTIRMSGRVISNPNHTAIVQSTVDGRLAPVNGKFPQTGRQVKAGEILAYVQPVLAAIDRSDVEQTAGTLDQEIALAANKVRQFKSVSTFPAERIKTAEIELENLIQRRASLSKRERGQEPLVAPIDGVITATQAVIGQVVTSKDVLFHIVEPKALWVEALAYDTIDVSTLTGAQAVAHDRANADLKLISSNPSLTQHGTVLNFEMTASGSEFNIGRNVAVLAETGEPLTGIILPRAAVVQAPNGQYVVFRHVEPERFEQKPVRFIEIDGGRVLLTSGVEAGEKIAVEHAALINQIR
jgi:cobalt-zinc-cadmium efflux system membrane fusion protein